MPQDQLYKEKQEQKPLEAQMQESTQDLTQFWQNSLNGHVLNFKRDNKKVSLETLKQENASILEKMKKKTLKGAEWETKNEILKQNRITILTKDTKWYGKDSPEMTKVKKDLERLRRQMEKKIGPTDDQEKIYQETLNKYMDAIGACKRYISLKKPRFSAGKRRLSQVKHLLNQIEIEKDAFSSGHKLLLQQENNIRIETPKDLLELRISRKRHGDMLRLNGELSKKKSEFMKLENRSYEKAAELCKDRNVMAELARVEEKYFRQRKEVSISFDQRVKLDSLPAEQNRQDDLTKYYYVHLKEIAERRDKVEKEQYDIIEKKAGEEAAKRWLAFVDSEHEKLEKERIESCKKLQNSKEYMMHNAEDSVFRRRTFIDPVWNLDNLRANSKYKLDKQDVSRFLLCFVRSVKRDASGHFASAQDRANHEFNRKLRTAIRNGDDEILTEIGREYVNILKNLPEPEGPEMMQDGTLVANEDKLLLQTDIFETRRYHELNAFSVVVNQKGNNNMIPALGTGLMELKEEDEKAFKLLKARTAVKQASFSRIFYGSQGHDYDKGFTKVEDEQSESKKLDGMLSIWKMTFDEYKKIKEKG